MSFNWFAVLPCEISACVADESAGMNGDLRLLDALLSQIAPAALHHLTEIGGDLAMIAMKWLMCLMINQCPTEVRSLP